MKQSTMLNLDCVDGVVLAAERYVFSRVAGVRIESGGVIIVNVQTARRALLASAAADLVVCFIDPVAIKDVLTNTRGDARAMVEHARSIRTMISLGVLVPEAEEIGPGPAPTELPGGWQAAADFIAATRTPENVEFLNTQEMSALLFLHLASGRQPSAYCDMPGASFIALPDDEDALARALGDAPLIDALRNRRTTRRFGDRPIAMETLSHLLRLTWGETARVDNPLGDYFLRKTSPSGGALHCIETYVIARNVIGVPPGSYHYSVRRHGLELVSPRHPNEWLEEAAADQYWVGECAAVFVSVPFLPRMAWKYNFSRAFRAVMAEAGHLSQTFNLVATALGLGPFTTAAMRDAIVERELKLDPILQPPLILNAVGVPESGFFDITRPRRESLPE